jgi:hypothetical protein
MDSAEVCGIPRALDRDASAPSISLARPRMGSCVRFDIVAHTSRTTTESFAGVRSTMVCPFYG